MWGHANYFAKNSSYSNGYAHSKPDGSKQMFVAKVLIGRKTIIPPDSSLRRPPMY